MPNSRLRRFPCEHIRTTIRPCITSLAASETTIGSDRKWAAITAGLALSLNFLPIAVLAEQEFSQEQLIRSCIQMRMENCIETCQAWYNSRLSKCELKRPSDYYGGDWKFYNNCRKNIWLELERAGGCAISCNKIAERECSKP